MQPAISTYSLITAALLATSTLASAPAGAQEPRAKPVYVSDQPVTAAAMPSATAANAASPEMIDPLRQALAAAYVYNPRLKAEREAVSVADEQVAVAVSGFRPSAGATYEKGRQRTATNSARWFYDDTETKELVVSQPLFNGGTSFAEYKAAKARVKQSRARLLSVEQQVLLDTVTAYADVLAAQSALELNRNNVGVLGKQLDATQARFNVGELTRTDVSQANARRSRAQADLRQAEANLKAAQARYGQVVGAGPSTLVAPGDLPSVPESLEAAIDTAVNGNPDLQEARYAEKAAGHDVYARGGDILPDVSLQGSMSRTKGSRFLGGTSQFDADAVTVNVNIPLYQSGAEYARLRAAKNSEQAAKYSTRETSDNVVQAVTTAYENYQASLSVIESTEASVKASEVALTGVRQENEFGVRTILDVLDAEQELFTNQVALVNAQRDRIVRAFTLLAATGQLTAQNLHLPVEIYDPAKHYGRTWWKPVGF